MLFCQKKDEKNLKDLTENTVFKNSGNYRSKLFATKRYRNAAVCENTKENITLPFTRKSKHHYYNVRKRKTSLHYLKKLKKIIFSFLYLEFLWFIQMAILPAAGKIFSFSPLAFRLPSNGSGYCCQ